MERIFLLEDDEALGRGIALALQTPDRAVAQAATLAQARALLQGQDFALLILDVNLPDGSGLDLVRDLRAAGHRVPILLLTANDLELDEVTGLEAGADDYITKPFSLAVLQAIGMTDRQLKTMLAAEGLLYTLGSAALTLVLALAGGPLWGAALQRMFWFFTYRFILWPIGVALPLFAVLGVVIPLASSRAARRLSVVDRLRQE